MLQDWVDAYQQNRAAATAELLTLLTQVTSPISHVLQYIVTNDISFGCSIFFLMGAC